MKPLISILTLLLGLNAFHLLAETPTAKPGPEQLKLAVYAGKWEYEATAVKSPVGPAGSEKLTSVNRFINGGFHLETRGKGRSFGSPYRWTEIYYFDPDRREYRYFQHDSQGRAVHGPVTNEGNTWISRWELTADGTRYQCRTKVVFAPDGKSYTYEFGYSEDGVNWKPWLTGKARRVGKAR